MKTYAIAKDEGYGWITGITSDGRQVIAADNVTIFFDDQGQFLEMDEMQREANWKERAEKLVLQPCTIHVRAFEIKGREIGIRPMPQSDMFVFLLGDDFWMNLDGTVNSH